MKVGTTTPTRIAFAAPSSGIPSNGPAVRAGHSRATIAATPRSRPTPADYTVARCMGIFTLDDHGQSRPPITITYRTNQPSAVSKLPGTRR